VDNFFEKIYRLYTRKRFVAYCSTASLAIVLGAFGWAVIALRNTGSQLLILHFTGSDGITSIGTLSSIVLFGIFSIAAAAMNFAAAIELDSRDRFLGKFVAAATLGLAILLFIGTAAIINANV
jgi:hypothetical protein